VKPRLLDLFCGAGGCARGYADAGFEVIGCDIAPQRHYPYTFYQANALDVLDMLLSNDGLWHGYALDDFHAIHASPPCQEYSQSRHLRNATTKYGVKHAPMLIEPVRARLAATGLLWIIENVAFSPLPDALVLCGSMFGLPVRRHRWFASNLMLFAPGPCQHTDSCINPVGAKVRGYGALASKTTYRDAKGAIRKRESYLPLATGQAAMGIDWMTLDELSQAIPPPYTEWIGNQLRAVIEVERVVVA